MARYYSGVGSRNTPKHILVLMQFIAFKLASEGWVLRSGGAKGADSAFFRGVREYYATIPNAVANLLAYVYVPWDGFGGHYRTRHLDFACVFTDYPKHEDALVLASTIHPNWKACDSVAKLLHGRNVFQILGHNMNEPSSMLICWGEMTKNGSIKGGTRTAWELAKQEGVKRLMNLADPEEYAKALRWVGVSEERLMALAGELQLEHVKFVPKKSNTDKSYGDVAVAA
jgi:hypothetical protein